MMKLFYMIHNPNGKRDRKGRVIRDIKRRKESRKAYKLVKDGVRGNKQTDYKTGGRKYKVGIKGKVDMTGENK